ncbi:hypothetical protein HL653_15560 [Sphingomonas sp. AP4-R1]|uniref:hypothetical protein n=1 Tax=Sphingomonas sp. AP4-R1 TaxID=2735134 RepID=UPI001493A431|nr:hypothetical protein [Sphingomonas sp. AP4-R1]QJU58992.1 hypothetical protein HL653_15560 [Sphingomonas sp. AP4-R1]
MTAVHQGGAHRPRGANRHHLGAGLALILAVGFAARVLMIPTADIYRPDELFQYLEQAHRIVFGHGAVTWEYRDNIRSLLPPLILAGPMALGDLIAPDSQLYIVLPRVLLAALSLCTVWSAWRFGARQSPRGGLIAAAIVAGWSEFIYLAPHILSEAISIALLLPAVVLLTSTDRGSRQIIIGGLLLGLAILLRVQHLPAAATLAALALWNRPRDWPPLLFGGIVAMLLGAGIDIGSGHMPFDWAIEYYRLNIVAGRAVTYGTAPAWAYARAIGASLGWATVPILFLAAVGARRYPILFRVGIVNLAVHMAVDHKEYSFILLTTTILILLAALGTAVLVEHAATRGSRWSRSLPWLALAGWIGMSVSVAAAGGPAKYSMGQRNDPAPFASLRTDPHLCGVATLDLHFTTQGGYTYLHRAVPMYVYEAKEIGLLAREVPGFNRLIAPEPASVPTMFRKTLCFAGKRPSPPVCIFARPGNCRALQSPAEINRMLIRTDQ